MPSDERLHEALTRAVKHLPEDYKPWGRTEKADPAAPEGWWPDCSSGCRHFLVLADVGEQRISFDWGVCINPKSHRYSLLTFEHQGCPAFEYDKEEGARAVADHERRRAEHMKRHGDDVALPHDKK